MTQKLTIKPTYFALDAGKNMRVEDVVALYERLTGKTPSKVVIERARKILAVGFSPAFALPRTK